MNLNKNERFKDYEKLLEESKENLNRSIKNKWQLDGFCYMLTRIRPGCNIADYEELLQCELPIPRQSRWAGLQESALRVISAVRPDFLSLCSPDKIFF